MAGKTRLIRGAGAAPIYHAQGVVKFVSGSSGASAPSVGDIAAATAPAAFEPGASATATNDAWAAELRRRELAQGIAATREPQKYEPLPPLEERKTAAFDFTAGGTRDPGYPTLPSPADLSTLPDRFTLEVERKGDIWKITAPAVHVGLFVADADLGTALAQAPSVLARIVRLDGVVARPKRGRTAR